MTVGELKKYLKNIPNDAHVYMLTDKSNSNWNDELGRWATVHPLSFCSKEYNEDEDGDELNLLLEIEE